MSIKPLIVILGLAALPVAVPAIKASAQAPLLVQGPSGPPPPRLVRRPRTRIEIGPPPLLYRRCAAWYELQHRPSGTVLFPAQHCWWVRGAG